MGVLLSFKRGVDPDNLSQYVSPDAREGEGYTE